MGLDIIFDAGKAIDAGMEIRVGYNDYRALSADGYPDCEKVEMCHYFTLPGMEENGESFNAEIWLTNFQHSGNLCGSVRANPWGRVYGPLTSWLSEKGIDWSEG